MAPIVPAHNVAGRALVCVIAIMTFLSCLTLGAVTLVRDTAAVWQSQISREVTIQIKPAEGLDMEAALAEAAADRQRLRRRRAAHASSTARRPRGCSSPGSAPGSTSTNCRCRAWSSSRSTRPIRRISPRLRDSAHRGGAAGHRSTITAPGSTGWWRWRSTTVTIGIAVLALMLTATVLTVVFATRGAMAGNGHIIEVLHFVGAEARFIAREFRRHFLVTGMKGAAAGGAGGRRRLRRRFASGRRATWRRRRPTRRPPCSAISRSAPAAMAAWR